MGTGVAHLLLVRRECMDRALLTHRGFPLTVNPTGVMDFLLWFETVSILTPAKYFLQYFLLVLYSFGGLKD